MSRGRVGALAAVVVAGAGIAVAVTDPFGSGPGANAGAAEPAATSLTTIVARTLSSQTQVDGTLGYAGSATVTAPSGTPPSQVRKAEQAVAAATAAVSAAQTTLALDERAAAAAARAPQAGGGASKLAADRGQLTSAQIQLAGAQDDLDTAEASAVAFEASATFTTLPSVGRVVRRGQVLYAADTQPTLLLYGHAPAWRAFRPGMSAGRDVAELNANLRALGYAAASGDAFTTETAAGISALQAAHGLAGTGRLPLGGVVFRPGAVRISAVGAAVGSAVHPGPVLTVTSTRHQVVLQVDAARQSEVHVGDRVTVTLPDNSTTAGRVSHVGSVAAAAADHSGGGGGSPTVEVDVRLAHERAAGRLDKAPVHVEITTASVRHALAVPVGALLALANGGYAVEVVDGAGAHRLVRVDTGLFDDADGLVQITGAGVHAGQRIVTAGA